MRLIDADALHNVLRKEPRWIVRNGDKHNEGYTYDQVHFAIDDMPTIEERKTGRWVLMSDSGGYYHCCSCCGHEGFNGMKFCPNCGVKMEGEDNATD